MAFRRVGPQEINVVVSTRAEVAEDAMRLAYDGGVESGFLPPNASGMRFSSSYLNEGTTFLVVYANERPIASLTVVEDGPFGLPCDRAFVEETDAFRHAGDSLFEAAAFVVAQDWRRQTMPLVGYLFGTAMRLNIGRKNRRFVSVVEPRRARVFSSTFSAASTAGPRPYMMLPGTLIATLTTTEWPDFLLHEDAFAPRRIVAERVFEAEPTWLVFGREGEAWKQSLLPEVLLDSPLEAKLAAQLALLRGNAPANSPDPAEGVMV